MVSPDIATPKAKRPVSPSGTVDIRRLAMIGENERIEVEPVQDKTIDAFDQTLAIIHEESDIDEAGDGFSDTIIRHIKEAPKDSDLRKVFVFAEILGGYDAFNDLYREQSPAFGLSETLGETVLHRELTARELKTLEDYHQALSTAVDNARTYYRETRLKGLSVKEMQELYTMASRARDKVKEINEILGKHLILKIESAIERLNEIRLKALGVERSISGIFLVEDEVMYIPVDELQEAIEVIFKGVGNPYLARNIDGVMLLAARNLLIEVVSFFAYYGKHQIYQLFATEKAVDRKRVVLRIRNEIRKILNACKEDNKLVLTRIMDKEEEQLDLSIEAIQREAEAKAVYEVSAFMPVESEPVKVEEAPGLFRRLFRWLGF